MGTVVNQASTIIRKQSLTLKGEWRLRIAADLLIQLLGTMRAAVSTLTLRGIPADEPDRPERRQTSGFRNFSGLVLGRAGEAIS
jgi:hypothetical protein